MLLLSLLAFASIQAPEALPEMTVTVEKLPADYRRPSIVQLKFRTNGSVSRCDIKQGSGSASIDRIACKQAKAIKTDNDQGDILPQSMIVAFTTDAPKR